MSNSVVLELNPDAQNSRNSEGSFVTLKDGKILFAYTKYDADANDDGEASIASRVSDDGGQTWTKSDRIIIKRGDAKNVMSVSLLRLKDGRIGLVYLRKDVGCNGLTTCVPQFCSSKDDGKTFSKPVPVITTPGYYVVNNDRIIQLKSGRIIVPVAMHRERSKSWFEKKGERQESFLANPALITFFFSDDGGKNWFESVTNYYKCFPSGAGLQEPGVVEMKDGRVWSWCRAGVFGIAGSKGVQWQSFSPDKGLNWPDATPSKFQSPCSPMSVKRIPKTGHLFAVWNDHSGRFKTKKRQPSSWGRTPLVTAISTDEGKTWKHHKLIEDSPDHGFCYIAIHFTNDAALLAYCAGGASTGMVLDRLRVRRIELDTLYR